MKKSWLEKEYRGGTSRLDKVIVELFSEISITRSQVKHLIEDQAVKVDGKTALKAGLEVATGHLVAINPSLRSQPEIVPSSRLLDILFEDDQVIVINKPPALTMHPGAGTRGDTLLNAVLGRLSAEECSSADRPGVVHRLDKDTSGVVVVAKTPAAHAHLAKQFERKSAGRRYLALVLTTPRGKNLISKEDEGVVSTQFGRHPSKRTLMAVVPNGKRRAVTNWRVVEKFSYGCLVELVLETGRTHQIRVHMAHIGSPVIGDRTYGNFSALPPALKRVADDFGRQALHARSLSFNHPASNKRLEFEAPMPDDMAKLLEKFKTFSI